MSITEMVRHVLVNVCNYDENKFELEQMEDNAHTAIIHCGRGFLHIDSTKELRERAIHVSATAKMEDEWPLTVLLTDIEAQYNSEIEQDKTLDSERGEEH